MRNEDPRGTLDRTNTFSLRCCRRPPPPKKNNFNHERDTLFQMVLTGSSGAASGASGQNVQTITISAGNLQIPLSISTSPVVSNTCADVTGK